MIDIIEKNSADGLRFILSPNRSISWPQLCAFYLGTCLLALVIGVAFSIGGVWLVLPFSGLEMLALGSALYLTSRKVYQRQVITLNADRVTIEKGMRRAERRWQFRTAGTRLIDEVGERPKPRRRLALGAYGSYVEIGEFLDNPEKDELAFQLKDCIIRGDF